MDAKSNAHRNRFVITAVILATFFLIMMGIGGAILGDGNTPSIEQEWKEILLLVLGAFLGSYSRVVDFWFNGMILTWTVNLTHPLLNLVIVTNQVMN